MTDQPTTNATPEQSDPHFPEIIDGAGLDEKQLAAFFAKATAAAAREGETFVLIMNDDGDLLTGASFKDGCVVLSFEEL